MAKAKFRFQDCIDTGAIDLIESLLLRDDILVQMNVLEIAKELGSHANALQNFREKWNISPAKKLMPIWISG